MLVPILQFITTGLILFQLGVLQIKIKRLSDDVRKQQDHR